MEPFNNYLSGWLNASGKSLLDVLPAGSQLHRIVATTPEQYQTGYVSTRQGSFKPRNESGNWYASTHQLAMAEVKPTVNAIYEQGTLHQNVPIWNFHKLPANVLDAISNDGTKTSGQFEKSQFIVQQLSQTQGSHQVSGYAFPSRRESGSVFVLNPQTVPIDLAYTGQMPRLGFPEMTTRQKNPSTDASGNG